ncbi:MAG: Ig-like domain-containing protein [Gemmataceae bacterium]|nr:Ig-like domain-containing protein [Gemmataceae bacterium]
MMRRSQRAIWLALAVCLPTLALSCGPSMSKVEVKVTLDGQPVQGATVVFYPEGEELKEVNPSGQTDANGVCFLKTGNKEGAKPGKYKATVTKSSGMQGIDQSANPADQMKAAMGGGGPPKGGAAGGPPGMMRPGGGPPGGPPGMGGAPRIASKNELPEKYGKLDQTPFTGLTVPSSGPIELKLSSN